MTVPQGYDAARRHAAFLDRQGRGKIVVAGKDRKAYLHAMLTNDILALQAGSGCYAAYLTPQGRMLTDMRVFDLGDVVLLELPASRVPEVVRKLDEFVFSEDVKIGDVTDAFAELRIVGPAAATVVASALAGGTESSGAPASEALAEWSEHRNLRATFQGETVVLAASSDLGVPGFDLFIDRVQARRLADAVALAGAAPLSEEAAEVLRLEAGRPLFGTDMGGETIPLEAGIESRAISLTKGCYPGQEVIIRVLHRGHGRVARRLVGLVVTGETQAVEGAAVWAGDREIGRVTSAAWSPAALAPIALGYVQRDFTEPGTEVSIVSGDSRLAARVSALPFSPA